MLKIILFGAGELGREALSFYGMENVEAFCDNDVSLSGSRISGKPVLSYEEFLNIRRDFKIVVSVGNENAIQDISSQLNSVGLDFSLYLEEKEKNMNKAVFTNVYSHEIWGKPRNGEKFCSGPGSYDEKIVLPYMEVLQNLILANKISSVTEIGCGDFWIMRKVMRNISNLQGGACSYCGIDIVEDVVRYNKKMFGNDNVRFLCMDASENVSLPDAELLIIRQVLQHLNNEAIMKILDKAKNFRYVLITEHIYAGEDVVYNMDIPTVGPIRLNKKSGVYLEKPPWNCKNIVHLLDIAGYGGSIRTSLIMNA